MPARSALWGFSAPPIAPASLWVSTLEGHLRTQGYEDAKVDLASEVALRPQVLLEPRYPQSVAARTRLPGAGQDAALEVLQVLSTPTDALSGEGVKIDPQEVLDRS
jgi:hypothetical protein